MSVTRSKSDVLHYKKATGCVWLDDETEILLGMYWQETYNKSPLMLEYAKGCIIHMYWQDIADGNFGKCRPVQSYMNISKKLKAIGYNRSPHQIRNKIKALRATYQTASRGTEMDRQLCFLYDDLDKCFRNTGRVYMHEDSTQMSSDEPTAETSPKKRHRQFEEANVLSNRSDIFEELEASQNELFADYAEDDEFNPLSTKRAKKPRITTTTNIERVSTDDHSENNLIEFMSDQLEKQRLHQVELTKIFTDAMSDQFKKFSDLITNLTQQMCSRKIDAGEEKKIAGILNDLPHSESN